MKSLLADTSSLPLHQYPSPTQTPEGIGSTMPEYPDILVPAPPLHDGRFTTLFLGHGHPVEQETMLDYDMPISTNCQKEMVGFCFPDNQCTGYNLA
jgi:hypothetical protein